MNQDKSTTEINKKSKGFTDEERAAMKERAQELKAEARANKDKADGESAVLAKIAEMPEPDRAMAERLHAIIKASAPALSPKTWYGMPAYAKDGKVVCFFQSAQKFNIEVRDVRLQRRGEPRRRRHVAGLLRAEGVDRRRRGKDRRAREESGELRTELASEPRMGRRTTRNNRLVNGVRQSARCRGVCTPARNRPRSLAVPLGHKEGMTAGYHVDDIKKSLNWIGEAAFFYRRSSS